MADDLGGGREGSGSMAQSLAEVVDPDPSPSLRGLDTLPAQFDAD